MSLANGSNTESNNVSPDTSDDDLTSDSSDGTRRHFLVVAAATTGLVGAGLAAWPFLGSLRPSARAQAVGGAVSVNIRPIEPDAQITVVWRGKPVWVLRRSAAALERMQHSHWIDNLRDPDSLVDTQQPPYAQNSTRSLRPVARSARQSR